MNSFKKYFLSMSDVMHIFNRLPHMDRRQAFICLLDERDLEAYTFANALDNRLEEVNVTREEARTFRDSLLKFVKIVDNAEHTFARFFADYYLGDNDTDLYQLELRDIGNEARSKVLFDIAQFDDLDSFNMFINSAPRDLYSADDVRNYLKPCFKGRFYYETI